MPQAGLRCPCYRAAWHGITVLDARLRELTIEDATCPQGFSTPLVLRSPPERAAVAPLSASPTDQSWYQSRLTPRQRIELERRATLWVGMLAIRWRWQGGASRAPSSYAPPP